VVHQGHAMPVVRMHLLAAWIQFDRLPNNQEVTSHRCHRKNCINPLHVCIELIGHNTARMACVLFASFNNEVLIACPHNPRCLRRDTEHVPGDYNPRPAGEVLLEETLEALVANIQNSMQLNRQLMEFIAEELQRLHDHPEDSESEDSE
jgi:hypothetical protein